MSLHLVDIPVKIFADGADLKGIAELYRKPYIHGLTTNPTLMRKAGLSDYESFARAVLKEVKSKPISFEVFSDDFNEMYDQAVFMASWRSKKRKIKTKGNLRESSKNHLQLCYRLQG